MTDYKLVPVEGLRYTFDGALAECPCCGSLDVGGAHDTVHCQSCGLTVSRPRPLQNAIDAWNTRTGRAHPAPAVQGEPSRESLMVVLERDEYGKPAVWCDPEIADLVSALNGSGVRTIASCSGHGKRPGNIVLADGRELVIARSFEESRIVDSIFQGINGEPARAVVVPKTAVQGEPVTGFLESDAVEGWHNGYGNGVFFTLDCAHQLYTAPQPAEQQPTIPYGIPARTTFGGPQRFTTAEQQPVPDVAGLLEALERSVAGFDALSGMASLDSGARDYARLKALELNAVIAAHRKGGGK